MLQEILMKKTTYDRLEAELRDLKNIQRVRVIGEIDKAREYGDLKENAEYHAAKERLKFIEAQIAKLSDTIGRSKIVDPASYSHDKVRFYSTVKLKDVEDGSHITYTVVNSFESNPKKNLISYISPLARAIMGKAVGDIVFVDLQENRRKFEILDIFYKK